MPYWIRNSGYSPKDKIFVKSEGHYIFDQEGRPFLDLAMGAGSLIFGHSPQFIQQALSQQASCGTIFLQNNLNIQNLSEVISQRIPAQLSNHIYCNSGSEATQRALRLARAATGKMKIASFHGGWHGMNEWTLLDNGGRFDTSVKPYEGIPPEILKYSVLLPYNSKDTFTELEKNSSDLAAIIIEPLQGSNPQPQIASFLRELVGYCNKKNILVIFDEIITGFRLHSGGAAQLFGIVPDIATYGKVLGGGLPVGLVTFNESVCAKTFDIPDKRILTGGTFSANPFVALAGLATLKKLSSDVYLDLNFIGEYFRERMNSAFVKNSLPLYADGVGSISRIYFTPTKINNREERDKLEMSPDVQRQFRLSLEKKNILWPTNGILCHSTCFTKEIANTVVDEVAATLLQVLPTSAQ